MKLGKLALKSLNNRKGNGFIQILVGTIAGAAVVFLISYVILLISNSVVTVNLNRITSNMADTFAQAQVVTPAMMAEYKDKLDANKYFVGDYKIEIIEMAYNKSTGSFSKTVKAVSTNGSSVGTVNLRSGTTIKVLFYGTGNNQLGKLLDIIKDTTITSVSAGEVYVD